MDGHFGSFLLREGEVLTWTPFCSYCFLRFLAPPLSGSLHVSNLPWPHLKWDGDICFLLGYFSLIPVHGRLVIAELFWVLNNFFPLFYYFCSSVIFSSEKQFSCKLYRLLIYFLLVSLMPSLRYETYFCKSWSTNLFLPFLAVRSPLFWSEEVLPPWVFWNHFQGGLLLFWSLLQLSPFAQFGSWGFHMQLFRIDFITCGA